MFIKKFYCGLLATILLVGMMAVASAGTSLPTKTTTGSYNGVFNALGETPLYYTNKNVKPTSTTMKMAVTGHMNVNGATSNFYSGAGAKDDPTVLGYLKLYNFDDSTRTRSRNYNCSFDTGTYYWASFRLIDRSEYSQLVGSFTFGSN